MAVVVLAIAFLATLCLVMLRFSTVLRQLSDNMRLDRAEYARQVDESRASAFADAMTALEHVHERIEASQMDLLARTFDAVAGPQTATQGPLTVDQTNLDARPSWMPDDEWDYTGLGIDPTDETMPMPRLEPEGNEGRATMIRPGEGLAPS